MFQSKQLKAEVTSESIRDISGPELVKLYNELTGESVVRFSSRGVGILRCQNALAEKLGEVLVPATSGKETVTVVDGAKLPKRVPAVDGPGRHRPIVRPAKRQQSLPKDGTIILKLLLLSRRTEGVSVEELRAEPEFSRWDHPKTVSAFRLLHQKFGWGIREDDQGRFHAFEDGKS